MSAVLFTEEQLLCSICLDVFTEPVSTPCGHNFCKSCISTHWQQEAPCCCPLCKQEFSSRPLLQVNTLFSELVGQFRNRSEEAALSSDTPAAEGDVLCDMCTESKQKALKSCLVCLMSYCQLHLLAHESLPRLKTHLLMEPLGQLEERLCSSHHRALELYCRSDQTCLCLLCTVLEHKNHQVVSLREEYEQQQGALESSQAETKSLMEKRQKKIRAVQRWLQLSDRHALTETERGERLHKALMDTVQSSQSSLTQEIQEQQRSAHRQAEDWTTQLQQELNELQRRSTELEQLQRSNDHLTFLQNLPRVKTTTGLKDWSQISLQEPAFEASVDRAMVQLSSTLSEEMKKQKNKRQLDKLKKWAVDVTLDPDTANPWLALSEDLKQVHYGGVKRNFPKNPKRFTDILVVLGKPGFWSGRFYFEVQVKGKTEWDLGVVKGSISRVGITTLLPRNGLWTVMLRDGEKYTACENTSVKLNLNSAPDVVGVFVDYEQGLVSFYDADSGALIYSFTNCAFTEKLYPFFGPRWNITGKNSTLIILPRQQTHKI
uniref:E3 ubiquitin-protein ligase TRIM39-like n=1 Tax=Neogobius melanostomus TaxID=47308 RepID=A0A8C6U329_9GOBI